MQILSGTFLSLSLINKSNLMSADMSNSKNVNFSHSNLTEQILVKFT